MRVFKTSYRDRHGVQRESAKWYVEFRDHNEVIRRIPASTSKAASLELGRNIEKLVAYHRATGGQVDPSLQQWLNQLPRATFAALTRINLIEQRRSAAGITLEEHQRDFRASLQAKGNTGRHVDLVCGRLAAIIEGCGFRYWGDISAAKVQNYLAGLRTGENGISAQTFNFYLQAMKQFCRWMVKERRAAESPIAHLDALNTRTDRRHDRRALSQEELILLLEATEAGPVIAGCSGQERSLVYRLAVETGLRAGEIRSLTAASFELAGKVPVVKVKAAYSKNRTESNLPLRPATAGLIREHLKGLKTGVPVFVIPSRFHTGRMIKADLASARHRWIEAAKADAEELKRRQTSDFLAYVDHEGLVADFHALRHTFISNLAAGGVHPKTAQALARHSTFALTMERYSHTNRDTEIAALRTLPELPAPRNTAQNADSVLALCLAQKGGSCETQGDSGGLKNDKEAATQVTASPGNTSEISGGEGIRTPGTRKGTPVFKTGAINRSATPPGVDLGVYRIAGRLSGERTRGEFLAVLAGRHAEMVLEGGGEVGAVLEASHGGDDRHGVGGGSQQIGGPAEAQLTDALARGDAQCLLEVQFQHAPGDGDVVGDILHGDPLAGVGVDVALGGGEVGVGEGDDVGGLAFDEPAGRDQARGGAGAPAGHDRVEELCGFEADAFEVAVDGGDGELAVDGGRLIVVDAEDRDILRDAQAAFPAALGDSLGPAVIHAHDGDRRLELCDPLAGEVGDLQIRPVRAGRGVIALG